MTQWMPKSASGCGPDPMPLDAVRMAFGWLLGGPDPLAVDGRGLPGLPTRLVPLDEVRDRLLARACPQLVRDAVWADLVTHARGNPADHHRAAGHHAAGHRAGAGGNGDDGPVASGHDGAAWTVGCAGVALPALTRIAAVLTARFVNDPRDVHAAILTGFLAELAVVDIDRPRIMVRLRWAAYRAGHACVRDALDAPMPAGHALLTPTPAVLLPGASAVGGSTAAGHPDLVLARAVTDGAISHDEAVLIGSTRLEGVSLTDAARARQAGYEATKKARRRAEHRLAAYLRDNNPDDVSPPDPDAAVRSRTSRPGRRATAARPGSRSGQSRSVNDRGARTAGPPQPARRASRQGMSPTHPRTGVQGRGSTSGPTHPSSSRSSSAAGNPADPARMRGTGAPEPVEVPRCS